MKINNKNIIFLVTIVLIFSGCVSMKTVVKKASSGYFYESSMNPENIINGNYKIIAEYQLNYLNFIYFYYDNVNDRVICAYYWLDIEQNILHLYRYMFVENSKMISYFYDKESNMFKWEDLNLTLQEDIEMRNRLSQIKKKYKEYLKRHETRENNTSSFIDQG